MPQPIVAPPPAPPPPATPLQQDYGVFGLLPQHVQNWVLNQAQANPGGLFGAVMRNFHPGEGPAQGVANMYSEMSRIDPGFPVGMVVNPENAAGISRQIFANLRGKALTPENIEAEFMRVKYPRFSQLANVGVSRTPPAGGQAGDFGRFAAYDRPIGTAQGTVSVFPHTGADPGEVADTVGHELTHAWQQRRDPIGLTTSYLPPEAGEEAYQNQYWERMARQGGATAKRSYEKYLSLVGRK